MWQSFAAIGRGSSEIWRRKKRKHHEHYISPPVTPYGRPNYKGLHLPHQLPVSHTVLSFYSTVFFTSHICLISSPLYRFVYGCPLPHIYGSLLEISDDCSEVDVWASAWPGSCLADNGAQLGSFLLTTVEDLTTSILTRRPHWTCLPMLVYAFLTTLTMHILQQYLPKRS